MSKRNGFTLVELLVVIAIIGILVSMLLPAVQSARESARRLQCSNNLKQLGLAAAQHHANHGYLPSGGWGFGWVGDADLGFGRSQPGAWPFSVLPFIEQSNVYSLGAGGNDSAKATAAEKLMTTPIATFLCPSRRQVKLYPINDVGVNRNPYCSNPGFGSARPTGSATMAKSCYAMNSGIRWPGFYGGPPTLATAVNYSGWPSLTQTYGVCWWRSEFNLAMVRDGTSNTLLIGEKSLNADKYESWDGGGDAGSMYEGHDLEANRYGGASNMLVQDRAGVANTYVFGGPHSGSCLFVICDGSVQSISYSIDPQTYQNLIDRRDGQAVTLP